MREISKNHQEFLDDARHRYGIDLSLIRKQYTLAFAVKLFKMIKRETKNAGKKKRISMVYPNRKRAVDNDTYAAHLKTAGFKIISWKGDFLDEDTGEIVTIKRHAFAPLKLLVRR